MKLNDFILLKAIYNEELSNAVLDENMKKIQEIIETRYDYELNMGFIEVETIDTEKLHQVHLEEINDEELMKRMI